MLKKGNVLFNFTPTPNMKINNGEVAYSLLSRDYKDNQCVVVLNDQGGKHMDVSYDVTATLRSETHGHLPCVIAFEPGIASRCGGHIYQDKVGTLRSNAGDNQQAVVIGAIDDTYRKQSN